jgi:hypothetical protein
MRRKDLEDRLTTRKQKPEDDDDARVDKIEALCAAQETRLKKVEDLLTELHATMARAAPPPFVEPAAPKQKGTKESGGKVQPKQGSNRTAKEVVITPDPDMDDAEDVATLPDPARKVVTETEESPDDCTETGDGAVAPPAQEEAPDARTKPEEAVDTPTEPDEGEGPEEDAKTKEAPQEVVETEEAATPNDVGSPLQGSHDGSDGPKAPSEQKTSSETTDEQQVVDTIATLSIEKNDSDHGC